MHIWSALKYAVEYYSYIFFTPFMRLSFFMNGVHCKENLKVRGHISVYNIKGTVYIGKNFTCNSAGWANPIGYGEKTYFQIVDDGVLEIGDYVGMSNVSITCASKVSIGDHVLIGAGVKIYDTDFHSLDPYYRYGPVRDKTKVNKKPVVVGKGAFIGAGSLILKGVGIGENSIIAANSVVTQVVPDNELWAGNPAKFIRKLTENQCEAKSGI